MLDRDIGDVLSVKGFFLIKDGKRKVIGQLCVYGVVRLS